jgi:hypothetical protein
MLLLVDIHPHSITNQIWPTDPLQWLLLLAWLVQLHAALNLALLRTQASPSCVTIIACLPLLVCRGGVTF